MPLTETAIRNAIKKPHTKPAKLADELGMYLLIKPDGACYWRLKYRFAGKEKVHALGVYPSVKLAEARDRREAAKRLLRDKKDPNAERKAEKLHRKHAAANSFQAVAEEWLAKTRNKWTPTHAERVSRSLELNLYDEIGASPISSLGAPAILTALRKIEARGAHALRERVQERASMIFRYAIATGRCERDPVADLRGAFIAPTRSNYAALTEKELPDFFKKLDAYDGEPITRLAIRLLALTFVRTGELRAAEWTEFDTDAVVWRIPAERMKMREPHIVPLSAQALAVLAELKTLTGSGRFVLPHRTNAQKSMSENTILYALYRMGYHTRATGHGFRSTASTILNEVGFAPDVIERQLAHAERNKVRAAYNRAQYLPERTKMMQQWADLLDAIKAKDKKVLHGRFGKAAA